MTYSSEISQKITPHAQHTDTEIKTDANKTTSPSGRLLEANPAKVNSDIYAKNDIPELNSVSREMKVEPSAVGHMLTLPSDAMQKHQHLNAEMLTLIKNDLKSAGDLFFGAVDFGKLALTKRSQLRHEIIRMEHKFSTIFEAGYRTAMSAKTEREIVRLNSDGYKDVARSVIKNIFNTSNSHLKELDDWKKTDLPKHRAAMNDVGFDYNFHFYVNNISTYPLAFTKLDTFAVYRAASDFASFDAAKGASPDKLARLKQTEQYAEMKTSIIEQADAIIDQVDIQSTDRFDLARQKGTFAALWNEEFSEQFDAAFDQHAPGFSSNRYKFTCMLEKTTLEGTAERFRLDGAGHDIVSANCMLMSDKLADALEGKIRALRMALPSLEAAVPAAAPSAAATVAVIDTPVAQSQDAVAEPAAQEAMQAIIETVEPIQETIAQPAASETTQTAPATAAPAQAAAAPLEKKDAKSNKKPGLLRKTAGGIRSKARKLGRFINKKMRGKKTAIYLNPAYVPTEMLSRAKAAGTLTDETVAAPAKKAKKSLRPMSSLLFSRTKPSARSLFNRAAGRHYGSADLPTLDNVAPKGKNPESNVPGMQWFSTNQVMENSDKQAEKNVKLRSMIYTSNEGRYLK